MQADAAHPPKRNHWDWFMSVIHNVAKVSKLLSKYNTNKVASAYGTPILVQTELRREKTCTLHMRKQWLKFAAL